MKTNHITLHIFLVAVFSAACFSLGGCVIPIAHNEAVLRPVFDTYDKVAIWGSISRSDEEVFIPLWMSRFPKQSLVERRDLQSIIGEQDIMPDRLDNETRAAIRKILGVKAIIYPSFSSDDQFSIKVIDTETGEIVASVLSSEISFIPFSSSNIDNSFFIRVAINSLKGKLRKLNRNVEPTEF